MPYEPIVPKGQHLGTSHEVDGAVTGHLFEDGTNRLVGHAPFVWVDEDDELIQPESTGPTPEEEAEAAAAAFVLAAAIVVGIVYVTVKAAPYVQRWWVDRMLPRFRSLWRRIRRLPEASDVKESRSTSRSVERESVQYVPMDFEQVMRRSTITMTADEWLTRFRAMLAAGEFQDEQYRLLARARLVEAPDELEPGGPERQLTAEMFAERLARLMAAQPALLDDETAAELIRVFNPDAGPRAITA